MTGWMLVPLLIGQAAWRDGQASMPIHINNKPAGMRF